MRLPEKPPQPDFKALTRILVGTLERGHEWALSPTGGAKEYLHWDDLQYLEPPKDLSRKDWWTLIKVGRQGSRKAVPLRDKRDGRFWYCLPDPAHEQLHRIAQNASGLIQLPESVTSTATRERYIASSLLAESMRSSQIEGAVTTRKAAKEVIRSGRKPRNRGEQMVLNNYAAMEHIREIQTEKLTPEILFELHRMLTESTLDDPTDCGRLRREDEQVRVQDSEGQFVHFPPPAKELPQRIQELCSFANDKQSSEFLHPVLRAIVLHFWLAYDHPFVDGNGRCARAVFYWSMLNAGYWLFEFLSISEVVYKARQQYYRAFLLTETDDNDLTYFILYHLKVVCRSLDGLHSYIERKARENRGISSLLRDDDDLNHRQKDLIRCALRKPEGVFTIEGHRKCHGVVYQTARTDLLELAQRGWLRQGKTGRAMTFKPMPNLGRLIQKPSRGST